MENKELIAERERLTAAIRDLGEVLEECTENLKETRKTIENIRTDLNREK